MSKHWHKEHPTQLPQSYQYEPADRYSRFLLFIIELLWKFNSTIAFSLRNKVHYNTIINSPTSKWENFGCGKCYYAAKRKAEAEAAK